MMIMKLVVFNNSNCNRNISILIQMRGQRAPDDVVLGRYEIFRNQQVRKMTVSTRNINPWGKSQDFDL